MATRKLFFAILFRKFTAGRLSRRDGTVKPAKRFFIRKRADDSVIAFIDKQLGELC